MGKESLIDKARRVVRFGIKTGIAGSVDVTKVPSLAQMVIGAGLNIKTVHALHARSNPNRPAVVDERRSLDYASMERAIKRTTAALRGMGVESGDRVLLCMENRVEYLVTWFALFRIGAPAVHASYRATEDELRYLFEHAEPIVAIASGRTVEAVRAACGDVPVRDADGDFWSWLEGGRGAETIDRSASGTNVVYTSGTTGKPKGAVRDFAAMGLVELSRIVDRLPLREGEKHLVVCPLYHSGAQALALIETSLGATIHLQPHFEPRETLELLRRERIESVFMVPTMIRRLLELPDDAWRENHPPALRCLISGAAVFPHALRKRAIRRFGASVVHDFYGATELGWITLIGGGEMMEHPGSVGRPLPGQEVKIVGRDGKEQPTGEVGRLYVRNEQVMSGYLADPNATSDTVIAGGWMTVDDLAHLDEDGYLYIDGRDRDMVISGGVNIYPVEIEEVLTGYPGVVEAAVIGVPDDQWGERLEACVVWEVREDFDGLETAARQALAGFKVPRRWHAFDELPRNPTGKILKRELRDALA